MSHAWELEDGKHIVVGCNRIELEWLRFHRKIVNEIIVCCNNRIEDIGKYLLKLQSKW
jgi:hypothetical protein